MPQKDTDTTNNYANKGMTLNASTTTSTDATSIDGKDVEAGTYNTRNFWKDTMEWDLEEDDVWGLSDPEVSKGGLVSLIDVDFARIGIFLYFR